MESIALVRAFKSGITNFWRNIWLSTAATLIMVITLMILTLTSFVVVLSNYAINNVQARVDVSVYFNTQSSEDQIQKIQSDLQNRSEVASVNYISAQQALDQFKKTHQNDPLILQSLDELDTNPLPPTLQVKAKNLNQYQSIVDYLGADQYKPYIAKINFEDNRQVIDRLSHILDTLKKIGIALALIFTFIAILVIFNTIRLTIYNRREEVEIMRLVGATNWYIRWPFIIESAFYSIAATIITALLLWPAFNYLIPRVNSYLGAGANIAQFRFINIFYLALIQLGIALLLGVISSFIAIRRYLRI